MGNLKCFVIFLVSIVSVVEYSSSQGVNCNGKGFICASSTSFISCVDDNTGKMVTLDNVQQTCYTGFYCNNADAYECISSSPPTTLKPTTRKPTTKKPTTRKPTTKKPTTRKPTTRKPTTRKRTSPKPTVPKCTSVGNFPDPTVPNCKGFITCIPLIFLHGFIQKHSQCPFMTSFDPHLKVCSMKYRCPTSTTSPCVSVGRMHDESSSSFRSYILCAKDLHGRFFHKNYNCPIGSEFNRTNRRCLKTSRW